MLKSKCLLIDDSNHVRKHYDTNILELDIDFSGNSEYRSLLSC